MPCLTWRRNAQNSRPGGSPFAAGPLSSFTNDPHAYYYLNLGDVVDFSSIMDSHPRNSVIKRPGINPIKNHSLGQWTK